MRMDMGDEHENMKQRSGKDEKRTGEIRGQSETSKMGRVGENGRKRKRQRVNSSISPRSIFSTPMTHRSDSRDRG
jgi:hypothetical protein